MKKLTCHCNAVEAEINISGNLDKTLRCNCSLCKRKGAVMSMVKNEDFKIVKGEDKLKLYQFHTKVAKHYFCSVCGIYTCLLYTSDAADDLLCVDFGGRRIIKKNIFKISYLTRSYV